MTGWPVTFVAGTIPTAANLNTLSMPPDCQAYVSGTVNVATFSSAYTLVPLASESYDYSTAMHDNSTNNSRVYARGSGKYEGQAVATFVGSNTTGYRHLLVYKNNAGDTSLATGVQIASLPLAPIANTQSVLLSFETFLTDGYYLEMYVRQSSGGSQTLATGAANTSLTLRGVSG